LAPGFFAEGFVTRNAGLPALGLEAGLRAATLAPPLWTGVLAAGLRALALPAALTTAGLVLVFAGDLRAGFAGFLAMVILAIREGALVHIGVRRENLK